MCSLYGGLSLANAKLGAIHGFAGVLGGIISTPHGAICAALLAACIRINVAALRAREPTNPALAKYEQAARLVCQDEKATVADLITWVDETCQICNKFTPCVYLRFTWVGQEWRGPAFAARRTSVHGRLQNPQVRFCAFAIVHQAHQQSPSQLRARASDPSCSECSGAASGQNCHYLRWKKRVFRHRYWLERRV